MLILGKPTYRQNTDIKGCSSLCWTNGILLFNRHGSKRDHIICHFFICEFWSMDLLRKQTLFSICRCRCTQIWKMVPCCKIYFHKWTSKNVLKTVKSQKIFEMLLRQWTWWARGCLPPSGFDHSSNIWHILPPLLRGIIMSESVFLISVRRRSL